jgi:superfamily II DNA/RNA helicase
LHFIKNRSLKTFSDLGISATFIKALEEINITVPTEIQAKSIPFLIEKGTDFIGQAQTGTGKTVAYGLPVLQAINPDKPVVQALILSPTRELGQQIAKQLFKFTKYIPKKIFIESTGRAGNKGFSLSMITTRERESLMAIEKELGIFIKEILR